MLVAHVADDHFDEAPGGRFEECIEVHRWMAGDMRDRGVELVLNAGDIYERASTPNERLAASDYVRRVGDFAMQVMVRGNHDRFRELQLLERLKTRMTVWVVENAELVHARGGVCVAAVAWPRRAGILKLAADRGLGHEGAEQIAGDALRAVLRGLGQEMAAFPDRPKILLMHAMVRGSKTSAGQPLVGQDMEVGLDDLRLAGADYYALGHIHKHQSWGSSILDGKQDHWRDPMMGCDIVYAGSPRRTAFGEVEPKGYIVYDTEAKTWELVPTPCAPMLLYENDWTDVGMMAREPLDDVEGAEVRVRYHVAADQQIPAADWAEELKTTMLAAGAKLVKLDPVVKSTVKAKTPQVAKAKTIKAKLEAYWDSQREDGPDPDRRERLLEKLETLEAEVM